jgi:hypothetical protein
VTTVAKDIAERLKHDNGVENAVASFHSNLPSNAMQCDLLQGQTAAWVFVKGSTRVKISKVAAEILVQSSMVQWNQLKRYKPKPIVIENKHWDPVTATASSLANTSVGMATSTANILVKPVQVFREAAKTRKQHNKLSNNAEPNHELMPNKDREQSQTAGTCSESKPNTVGKALSGSVSGIGGFFHHFKKGMLLDMPLAATEGLRAIPMLYGGEVRDNGIVKDWKSGMVVAGKNFANGITEGASDLVNEPIKGAQKGGTLGGAKGVAKGIANATTKISSGKSPMFAFPCYLY